ncbi:FAST kinase domain-containing protein 5, mitochondrial [Anoplophora glabripennis]|uniref:FAST kinase domain-containing protein 5, mitochondrial n=1 Tax=Anoplophora glabripennis TaxID=217634 RepID=UPI0008737012|nr:FAST kinase domain-containing protein 5, mitochondrial [Anoplophora glabripennis]
MLKHALKYVCTFQLRNESFISRHLSIYRKPQLLKPNLQNLNVQRTFCVSKATAAKLFYDYENAFAFSVINKDANDIPVPVSPLYEITTLEEFNEVLNQNWRRSSCTEIVNALKNVTGYCISNGVNISDTRFDKLVDGLMDHCEKLSDTELFELLQCLSEIPPCDSASSHNFHDVWSCLDDICCWKMIEWDIEKMFKFANIWYKLNLAKMGDYIFAVIDRLTKKADRLTKDQLVHVFFYFNVCRKRAVDFEYEYALEKKINEMNVDEVAVVAMGYFKTKTKIKLTPIIETMVRKINENSKSIHEISLAAIIKVIRLSKPIRVVSQIQSMLDQLYVEMDRLSNLCCLHIALIGTGIQTPHNKTIQKASERLVKDITDLQKVRLKDIERLLNVLSMFYFDPKTEPDIFKVAHAELHREERLAELVQYPRCLACALNYLSIKNIYSYEFMNKVLDLEYINDTYGKGARCLPRELLLLDASVDIECPDYKGNRLPPELRRKATKWVIEYIPSNDQPKKITAADQLFLDVIDTVKDIVKNDSAIKIEHIMPHFSRADIILCREKKSGKFVPPCGFESYVLGDVMFPYKNESLEWYAISILGWNNTIRDSTLPLGNMIMKKRQLEKMGYVSIFVIWSEFLSLPKESRVEYIVRNFV